MPPKRAKKKPSKRSRKFRGLSSPTLEPLKWFIPALVLVVGQVFFLRGSHGIGIAISLGAILLGAFFFTGWSLPTLPVKKISWKNLLFAGGVLGSLLLAALGQSQMIQVEGGDMTLWKGLGFYLSAVVLFLTTFWARDRERLQRAPLSPRVEWTAFGLIMVVALFFRLYRIKDIPAGLFIDEGFAGYAALRVLHEGWRFFYIPEPHQNFSLFIYLIALWFKLLSPTAVHFTLFSVFMGVLSLPLIYWTYRQWAGPRVALVGLFILSVMRWNINFTRNSQRTELMPLFMFGAISCLLYGYRNKKRWAFLAGGFFLGAGFYTYQSYKLFPFLILLYIAYEAVADWKKFKSSLVNIGLSCLLFLVLVSPMIYYLRVHLHTWDPRLGEISMMDEIRQQHSLKPLIHNTWLTALMFNRRGDSNPRHNWPDHRMLDDVTGVLFVLGVFYALRYAYRRKYFYALAGLVVMTLPCLLTTDAAHANRMMGTTPFTCFLAAVPIAALWGRVRAVSGKTGEILLVAALAVPLCFMAVNNFRDYFEGQANNFAVWAEFSTPETSVGKAINLNQDAYEYYLTPRYFNHYTILFLGYFQQNHTHPLRFPEAILPSSASPGRGLFYAFEQGREGVLKEIESVYPDGREEDVKGPNGQTVVSFYYVPAKSVDAARGLKLEKAGEKAPIPVPDFPLNLPPGPYHGIFTGSLFIDKTGDYSFSSKTNGTVSWWISGRKVLPSSPLRLIRGFHPVRLVLEAPAHPTLELFSGLSGGKPLPLDPGHFAAFSEDRGFRASFYESTQWKGDPVLVQWEPVINYVNGNDFPNLVSPVPLGSGVWTGTLMAPESGEYQFVIQSYDRYALSIDHRKIPLGVSGRCKVSLTKGPHTVEVRFQRTGGWFSSLNLYWIKPGSHSLDIVPSSAFAEVQ